MNEGTVISQPLCFLSAYIDLYLLPAQPFVKLSTLVLRKRKNMIYFHGNTNFCYQMTLSKVLHTVFLLVG